MKRYNNGKVPQHNELERAKYMIIDSKKAEEQAVLNLAYGICAAMRTAPKTLGIPAITSISCWKGDINIGKQPSDSALFIAYCERSKFMLGS